MWFGRRVDSPHTEMADGNGIPSEEEASDAKPHYFGLGCFCMVAGFAGGGMIGVLIAKIIGAARRCPSEAETGAPCSWFTFAVFGAIAGAVVLPVIAISLLRRARMRTHNSE
jgi:hypothetical protein